MLRMKRRVAQLVLLVTFPLLCWCAMMATHELGHALAAVATGGRVVEIHLQPLTFSHTLVDPNPRPLIVAWAGPVLGSLLPLALWAAAHAARRAGDLLLRWFAGFCLIANGAYLGLGWIDRIADAGDLLRHGATTWQLLAFGVVCVPLGLALWHNTGPAFGLGRNTPPRSLTPHAIASAALLAISIAAMLAWTARSAR